MNNNKSPVACAFHFRFHTEDDIPLLYEKHCKNYWAIFKSDPMPIDRFIATIKRFEEREKIPFIIADSKTNSPIGEVRVRRSIYEPSQHNIIGIQLWAHMEYASEVVKQLLAVLFSNSQIDSVRWVLSQRQTGAIAIACDIGMHFSGTIPKHGKPDQTQCDEYIYVIERWEWEQM